MSAHPGSHNAREGYGLLQRHRRYFSASFFMELVLHETFVPSETVDVLGNKRKEAVKTANDNKARDVAEYDEIRAKYKDDSAFQTFLNYIRENTHNNNDDDSDNNEQGFPLPVSQQCVEHDQGIEAIANLLLSTTTRNNVKRNRNSERANEFRAQFDGGESASEHSLKRLRLSDESENADDDDALPSAATSSSSTNSSSVATSSTSNSTVTSTTQFVSTRNRGK